MVDFLAAQAVAAKSRSGRQVLGGSIVFPFAKAREVLSFYGEYSVAAPDELYLDFFMGIPPGGGDPEVGLQVCYSGPENGADRALAPIGRLGTPLADQVKAMDYVAIQKSGDVTDPRAMGTYLKSGFTRETNSTLVAAIMAGFEGHPARATQVFTQHCGGAIGRVATPATAFAHRYAQQNLLIAVAWKTGDDPTEHIRWARQYWATLERFTSGFYTNEVGDESAGVVNANYRENYRRLVAVKNKYDPGNLFRLNANVTPAA